MEDKEMSLTPRLDEAYAYWGKEKKLSYEKIQNPGAKSVNSMVSKIKRFVEQLGHTSFSMSEVTDAARCSVLFNSYEEVSQFLKSFKQEVPEMEAWVSKFNTGYKGIHMCFEIDGVSVELQASTEKAWPYKVIAEEFYAKWRDFNQKEEFDKVAQAKRNFNRLKEQRQNNPESVSEKELEDAERIYRGLNSEFKAKLAEQKKEFENTQALFAELHSDGDFAKNEVEIESTLLAFEIEKEKKSKSTKEESDETKRKRAICSQTVEIDENGKVVEEDAIKKATEVNEVATKTQEDLINSINKTIENMSQKKPAVQVLDEKTRKQMQYKEIAAELLTMNNEYLQSKVKKGEIDEVFLTNNVRAFQKNIYGLIKSVVQYAEEMDMMGVEPTDLLKNFYKHKTQEKESTKEEAGSSKENFAKETNELVDVVKKTNLEEAEQIEKL